MWWCLVLDVWILCVMMSVCAGSVCGLDIDECVSTPCHNGGLCRNNFASFICDCPKPYQGVNCALLPCEVNPCGPGGSNCTNDLLYLPLGFRCQCVEGYTGQWFRPSFFSSARKSWWENLGAAVVWIWCCSELSENCGILIRISFTITYNIYYA